MEDHEVTGSRKSFDLIQSLITRYPVSRHQMEFKNNKKTFFLLLCQIDYLKFFISEENHTNQFLIFFEKDLSSNLARGQIYKLYLNETTKLYFYLNYIFISIVLNYQLMGGRRGRGCEHYGGSISFSGRWKAPRESRRIWKLSGDGESERG